MSSMVQIDSVSAYLVRPEGLGPWPGLIVIHEWWGLDQQTRSIADRFAGRGYMAVAPDLYEGELASLGDSEKAAALKQKYTASAPAKLEKVFDSLKVASDCTGRIGSVGFCFGGRASLALGLTRPLDAVVTFYGGGMQQLFDQMERFKASAVLGLFGDKDVSIPAGTVQDFDALLSRLGIEHQIIVYPDSGHSFFRDSDPGVYKAEASKDAWDRVMQFFALKLS